MDHVDFTKLMAQTESPVVLLEGTRELPPAQAPDLTAFAAHLARTYPRARFRTGNARGSDEALARGVAGVDASRLEFVLPYATHRRQQRPAESRVTAIDDISAACANEVIDATVAASPQYERVAVNYRRRTTASPAAGDGPAYPAGHP